ncbi:hypothetical protein V6Z12_D13G171600 [Gossypium hirsutum]
MPLPPLVIPPSKTYLLVKKSSLFLSCGPPYLLAYGGRTCAEKTLAFIFVSLMFKAWRQAMASAVKGSETNLLSTVPLPITEPLLFLMTKPE